MRKKRKTISLWISGGPVISRILGHPPIIIKFEIEIDKFLKKIKYFEGQNFEGVFIHFPMGKEYSKNPYSLSRYRAWNYINYSKQLDGKDLENKKLYEYGDIIRRETYDALIYIARKYKISEDKIKKIEQEREKEYIYDSMEDYFLNMKMKWVYEGFDRDLIEMLERVKVRLERNRLRKMYLKIKYFIFKIVRDIRERGRFDEIREDIRFNNRLESKYESLMVIPGQKKKVDNRPSSGKFKGELLREYQKKYGKLPDGNKRNY